MHTVLELTTSLNQLEGLALIDESSSPHTISYYPVHNLPEDINDRFIALFTAKEKWTLHEITPYIR